MEIILRNKYKIENLVKSILLSEALDGIAYTLELQVAKTEELKRLGIPKGSTIKLIDISANTNKSTVIFNGIVWTRNSSNKNKEMRLRCKERTVYVEESEDEYIFPAGQTATQRIKKYCSDWHIPYASLINTGVKLAKTKCRRESILSMMSKDIKETAQKGGSLYKIRMLDRLNIIKLGSNNTIWRLETIAEDIEETSSLQGAVTQVKVLGKNDKDEAKSPVIGVYKKNINYGTLQKVVQDSKVTNGEQAKKKANSLFNTGEESVKVSCAKDINTIRSGDVVSLNGTRYYVIDITHRIGSNEGMDITLGQWDYVKRRFYSGDI
ncbi:XkdQ/YqbQ family protein [Clostridium oceanicum]|uniref:YqbQ/XkdQ domain-containing protein n=1 Tax=Clostridium oceanicum TaxID=1543 RepID=A0ABP3ULC2_9CLOT